MKIIKKIIFLIIFIININVLAEGEATINNIKVNGKDATCTGYDCVIEVDSNTATVTYNLIDANASADRLSGFSIDLTSPSNLIKIIVKNDQGDEPIENIYSITINKHQTSGDYTLNSLKVNDEDIKLTEDVYVYNYESKYDDEKIVIMAKPNDSKAKITTDLEFDFPLDRSSIALDFDVKAENDEIKTYRIVVNRGIKPNTYLKSLKIDKIDLKFDKEKLNYNETVEYNVNELNIEAVADKDGAKVEIDKPDTLEVGENIIKIKVTNEKAESIYEIKVIREPNLDKSLANLKKLEILEYPKLNFEPNVIEYNLKFKEIPKSLTIQTEAVDNNAKIEILNNEDLINEDKIIIKVTLPVDEAIIVREYTLNIIESKSIVTNNISIIISIIVEIIVIIVLLILEIKDKKNKKKNRINKIKNLVKRKHSKKNVKKEEEIEII